MEFWSRQPRMYERCGCLVIGFENDTLILAFHVVRAVLRPPVYECTRCGATWQWPVSGEG